MSYVKQKWSIHSAIIATFACVPLMGWGSETPEPRDCDGYQVTDSAQIDSLLTSQLDTAASNSYLNFGISFWWPGKIEVPDSCKRAGAQCGPFDTVSVNYWRVWVPRVLNDYHLFIPGDTVHRLQETAFSTNSGSTPELWATKSTILDITKECYVREVFGIAPWVPVDVRTKLKTPASKIEGSPFHVNGRKSERPSDSRRQPGPPTFNR